MASTCIAVVDVCATRVSKLTTAGAPMTGANNGYVTHSQQSVQFTFDTEDGRDETLKNGCNEIIATVQDPDQIKGISISTVLTKLDAYLEAVMLGSDVFTSGGNAIGGRLAAVGTNPPPICYEVWAKAWSSSAQLVDPFTSPLATYIHIVVPYLRCVRGNTTLALNPATIPIDGKGRENTALTVNGPFDDWPSAVATQGGCPRLFNWFYDGNIPAETCAYTAVTSAAS